MPTAKYDWEQAKKDYLASDFIEVEGFLRGFLEVAPNKPITSDKWARAKGWRQEKEGMKKLQTINAVGKMADDPDISKFTQLMIQAKQNAIAKVAKLIGGNKPITEKDIPAIAKGIEIINLELGIATNITKLQGDPNNPIKFETEVSMIFGKIPQDVEIKD